MATSSAMNTSNDRVKYTISITQNSQSVANNTSNVTVSVRFYRTNTGYETYGTGTVYCKIDGTQYTASVTPSQKITNSGIVLFTKTLDISHGNDGKKTLTCSAWINHDVVTSSEQSYSQALSTIYRASVPTVSESSVQMGSTLTINTNRKSSSFTHTLTVTMGGGTGTIATGVGASYNWKVWDLAYRCNNATSGSATITCTTYNGSTKIGEETCNLTITVPSATVPVFTNGDVIIGSSNPIQTSAGSTNFTHIITYSFNGKTGSVNSEKVNGGIVWNTPADLARYIKTPSGKGTVICYTYNGTALVGTRTVEFNGVVPEKEPFKPILTSFSIFPSTTLPSAFDGLYIQGKSGVRAYFTASSEYSAIASYKLTADGRNFFGNPATSYVFTRDGNFTVTGTAIDERGFTETASEDVTVYPYSAPTIDPCDGYSSIICERSLQDGTYDDAGTYLHIKCKRKYSPVIVDGLQKNTCHLQYQYKVSGGSWSSVTTLLSGSDTSTDDYEGQLPNVVTQTDKSYTVRLIVTDTVGSSEPYEFPIATDDVTIHLGEGGENVSIGQYCNTNKPKLFECHWDAEFKEKIQAKSIRTGENGEIVYDGIVEEGNSGIWTYIKYESGIAICWGTQSFSGSFVTEWGSLYVFNPQISRVNYPFQFSSRPNEHAEIRHPSNAVITFTESGENGMNTQNATAVYGAARPTPLTEQSTIYVDYVVIGRWK